MMPYIINVALILAGCLAFYKVLLRKETFYRLNRYVLIGCLFISFSLPLISVPEKFSFRKNSQESTVVMPKENNGSQTRVPALTPTNSVKPGEAVVPSATPDSPANTNFSFQQLMNWMFWLYWFGVIAFGLNFILQLIILLFKSRRNPVIIDGKFRIVEISGDTAPCSFGNNIFINPGKYEWDTYNQILLHEKVHIRQKHTLDILLAELVLVFQWFNPFAWIYRREMENNLEFLTDDQLTQKEKLEPESYQLSLLKVSAPHFPLSLTTNYNQSILKKRIAMMNTKRSNLHTAWKYFFLLPVLALFACLLNEPQAQSNSSKNKATFSRSSEFKNEGYWFAIIKDDKVNIRFSDEEVTSDEQDFNHGSHHSSTFKLSELGNLPKGSQGTFKITREAGTMELTGRFEGNTGMGRYKYNPDQAYTDFMNRELGEKLGEDEPIAFFFIDIKKAYLQTIKGLGFTKISKDELISMAALRVDGDFIKSIKDAGFKDVNMDELVSLKALGINKSYIEEIRGAGYKTVDLDQLISFKAQGIDKDYISKVRTMKGKDGKDMTEDDADDIVSFKAMNITEEYVNSFKSIGLNLSHENLVSYKALGVTPEYIKSWHDLGFKSIEPGEFAGMKSQNVTPEYLKSFYDMGYKNVKIENLISFKALGVTPEFIKSFEAIGYKDIDLDQLNSLKALNITPEFIKGFENIGYKNIQLDELSGLKATGVTPEYIKTMREKGFKYESLQKYITLKTLDED